MPDSFPYDEKELLLRIADGDEKAFGIIYKLYAPRIFASAMSYTNRNKVLSEDIIQVLFARVWVNRCKVVNIKNLADYLFISARNILFDNLKKQSVFRSFTSEDIENQADSETVSGYVEQKEFDVLFRKAVDLLPAQQKMIYHMAHIEGVPHDQIATQTGLKLLTVRTHLKLAVRSVRNFVAAHLSEPFLLVVLLFRNIFDF